MSAADARTCPVCGAPASHETRPFCSKRCADVDLSRWLKGVYRIPAVEGDEGPEDATEEAGLAEHSN